MPDHARSAQVYEPTTCQKFVVCCKCVAANLRQCACCASGARAIACKDIGARMQGVWAKKRTPFPKAY